LHAVVLIIAVLCCDLTPDVVAMHIQLSKEMFAALTASQLGYIMKQRGQVEIKVKHDSCSIARAEHYVHMTV